MLSKHYVVYMTRIRLVFSKYMKRQQFKLLNLLIGVTKKMDVRQSLFKKSKNYQLLTEEASTINKADLWYFDVVKCPPYGALLIRKIRTTKRPRFGMKSCAIARPYPDYRVKMIFRGKYVSCLRILSS